MHKDLVNRGHKAPEKASYNLADIEMEMNKKQKIILHKNIQIFDELRKENKLTNFNDNYNKNILFIFIRKNYFLKTNGDKLKKAHNQTTDYGSLYIIYAMIYGGPKTDLRNAIM